MIAPQSRKSVRRARWLSIRHGRVRSDIRQPWQLGGQVMEFDATRRLFVCRFTVAQLVASARSKLASEPAALKSP